MLPHMKMADASRQLTDTKACSRLSVCKTAVLLLQALVDEGKIKYIGLSEVGADDLRKAHAVHPITAVQLEWSLWTRDVEVRHQHSAGPLKLAAIKLTALQVLIGHPASSCQAQDC